MRITKVRGLVAGSLVAAGLAIAVHAQPAAACSCAVAEGPELLGFADVAFTGTLEATDGPADPASSMDAIAYDFSVEAVYKGTAEADALVYSANNSASCGLEGLTVGARYLVFATRIATEEEASFLPGSEVGALTSGLCSGTAELTAEGPPAFLGSGRPPAGQPAGEPAEAPTGGEAAPATGSPGDDGGVPVVPIALGAVAVAAIGVGTFAWTRRRHRTATT
jgi:hypothetical protein